jgi:hypothetical protein
MAVAFAAVCPTRLDLIHPHYRRLCRTLADVDEWGQVNLLDLLLRYVRTMLAKPPDEDGTASEVDSDLHLLLTCAEPLFMSRNPAVSSIILSDDLRVTCGTGGLWRCTRLLLCRPCISNVKDSRALAAGHAVFHRG